LTVGVSGPGSRTMIAAPRLGELEMEVLELAWSLGEVDG
jgi:hypothetical protein